MEYLFAYQYKNESDTKKVSQITGKCLKHFLQIGPYFLTKNILVWKMIFLILLRRNIQDNLWRHVAERTKINRISWDRVHFVIYFGRLCFFNFFVQNGSGLKIRIILLWHFVVVALTNTYISSYPLGHGDGTQNRAISNSINFIGNKPLSKRTISPNVSPKLTTKTFVRMPLARKLRWWRLQ